MKVKLPGKFFFSFVQKDWNEFRVGVTRGRGWQKSHLCLNINLLIISLTFEVNVIIFLQIFWFGHLPVLSGIFSVSEHHCNSALLLML